MKNLKLILIFAVAGLLFAAVSGSAQSQKGQKNKKHRVVFELSGGGEEAWQSVLNNVENVQKSFGQAHSEIEVVMHGKGLGMILKTNTSQEERLKMLSLPRLTSIGVSSRHGAHHVAQKFISTTRPRFSCRLHSAPFKSGSFNSGRRFSTGFAAVFLTVFRRVCP